MMAKRQSLGRGLNALIPDVSRETGTKKSSSGNRSRSQASSTSAGQAKKVVPPAKKTAPGKATGKAGSAKASGQKPTSSKATAKPVSAKNASSNSSSANRSTTNKAAPPTASTGKNAGIINTAELATFEVAGLTLTSLPVRKIKPNPVQPRTHFDDEALTELVHSISEIGLLQPIVVRPVGNEYELVAGERRLRASKKAGLKEIPALIRQTADEEMLRDALLENLHRAQLTPLEEAAAYQQLLEDFGCTQDELAKRLGRSRPQISNTIRLLNLPPSVQRRVAAGVLSAGHARALLAMKDQSQIEKLAARIVSEGLSVRNVEEIIAVGIQDDKSKPTTKTRKPTISAPGLAEIGDQLSQRLDTRVTVTVGQKRGKIIIEFATLEDLRRIVEIVNPPTRGMFGEPLL